LPLSLEKDEGAFLFLGEYTPLDYKATKSFVDSGFFYFLNTNYPRSFLCWEGGMS
jgi:hypothetical protein